MTISEVGSGQVPIFPTFKGFRTAVSSMVDGTTRSATTSFRSGFGTAGTAAGRSFKQSFSSSTSGAATAFVKSATAEVAKASRDLANARLKELDVAGKVRVAEAQMAEARRRYAADSSQVIRAEERFGAAYRSLLGVQDSVKASTDRLAASKRGLAQASADAAANSAKLGGSFAQLPTVFGSAGSAAATQFGTSFRSGIGTIFAGSFLANIATGAARGFRDLITTGIEETFKSVDLASTLQQSIGAVDAVFKDQSPFIQNFGKDAATSVGLARQNYLTFATVVGAQLKNLKVPFDQVAGKTNDIITLGADLAAQFGGDTAQAVSALSSLLRGERDPIERYGVSLKQTDIDARKAAMGLSDLTGEADKQADIQATLALLWEQTSDAQGTFARESETYAHKQQVFNAQLLESQTRLGESLLPAFTGGLTFLNDNVLPKLDQIVDTAGPQLGQALIDNGPEFEKLWAKAEPLIDGLISAAGEQGIPAFIDIMNQMVEAAPGWADAWSKGWDPEEQPAAFLNAFSTGFMSDEAREERRDFWFGQGARDRIAWFEGLFEPGEAKDGGAKLGTEATGGLNTELPAWRQAGNDFAAGFGAGIDEKVPDAAAAAQRLAEAASASIRSYLQIESPSKVAEQLGLYTGDGFSIGLDKSKSKVDRSASNLMSLSSVGASAGASASVAGGSGGDRPIYADGTLIGWIREIAGGETRLVMNQFQTAQQRTWREEAQ